MTDSPRLLARIAGVSYLLIIVVGGFGYLTGSSMIVSGDASATAGSILASEQSWRLGVAAMLFMLVCDVAVASLFYVLLKPVNSTLALLGFAFRIVMTAMLGVTMLARLAPIILLRDRAAVPAFEPDQMQAAAFLSLELFEPGFNVALVFFGIDCLVIGWLILKSTFLPRILGAALAAGGFCYLVNSFADLLFPAYRFPFDILLPSYVAELALALWLLAFGVNETKWKRQAGSDTGGATLRR